MRPTYAPSCPERPGLRGLLRRGHVRITDAAVDQPVDHAFRSPARLRDAIDLLGEDEQDTGRPPA